MAKIRQVAEGPACIPQVTVHDGSHHGEGVVQRQGFHCAGWPECQEQIEHKQVNRSIENPYHEEPTVSFEWLDVVYRPTVFGHRSSPNIIVNISPYPIRESLKKTLKKERPNRKIPPCSAILRVV